ncbi:MAG TPA: pyruvate formate lyase family protein, partial [bacterium]|nr:pyruvate formate lyase family protein [bacterium]
MTERVEHLRDRSVAAEPSISAERARLVTEFYRENEGEHSPPVMRALVFRHLCERKTLFIDAEELIVGERGPAPKATPTYPELTCHSIEDLRILDSREKTSYAVSEDAIEAYEREVIPYWKGRSLRDRMFERLPERWRTAYDAGIFTEFMEQRAPGHTVADGKIYSKGMLDFKARIAAALEKLEEQPEVTKGSRQGAPRNPLGLSPDELRAHRREQLRAMDVAADAVITFATRHSELASEMAERETDPERRNGLKLVAETCARVPANAPRTFMEALQTYWFCHLAVITELNGWDAFNPGHLDQHLQPFYEKGLADGTLTRERAKELLECFFIKFNNHPAPPKVGVTAAESGTYTDFANINLGGMLADGSDGSNEITHMLLDIIDEMHLLQPSSNLQLSRKTPDKILQHTLKVVRKGYGFPSIFNADVVVEEQLRQGKSIVDARAGGCSGCVEV